MTSSKRTKKPYILIGEDAQKKILAGAKLMYDCVCCTLGPKADNVAIQRPWGLPIVVHDGVTISRECRSRDRFVQMGINLIKEAAQKTNDEAGDGTTTSTLLAYELIARGMKLKSEGINPMILRQELREGLQNAKKRLSELSRPVKKAADLVKIATVASADKEIGEMVGKAVYEIGADGLVTVEESGTYETWVDRTEGMSLNKGFASPYFVTDPFRLEATVNKPVIVITDKQISTNREIVPIIEFIIKDTKNIVIVGEVSGEALATLVTNKVKGIINCVVIKPPGYGDHKTGFLEDLALVTGGQVISKELGMENEKFLKVFNKSFLGKCDKVVVDEKSALLIGGKGKKTEVNKQIEGLRELNKKANKRQKEIYDERIAKLTSGVAVIRVGAKTEMEGREKVERVKDAVGAAQAALAEGYVAGSGVTFLHLAVAIKGNTDGDKLLRDVLEQPLRKVMENSGETRVEINQAVEMLKKAKPEIGYEAMSGGYINLIEKGIIDPVKVIRLCLSNAVSIATTVLTTEVLIDHEVVKTQ